MNKIWKVTRQDIEEHLADWKDNGVIDRPIANIYGWPGRGNAFFDDYNADAIELDQSTAPFFDQDGEALYNPDQGDFPILDLPGCDPSEDDLIQPDEMYWFSYNDFGPNFEVEGASIGAEVQCMVFVYNCSEETPLNNSIFVHYRIINRSLEIVDSMYVGTFADFDIGNPADDFIGSDPSRNILFGYNGDATDEDGYESNPPAMVVQRMRGLRADDLQELPIAHALPVEIKDDESQSILEFYRLLSGSERNGDPLPNDGQLFTGDPNGNNLDNEVAAGNVPGERSGLMSTGPIRMMPGAVQQMVVGYTFYQKEGNDYLQNVTEIYAGSDQIQSGFDACMLRGAGCNAITSAVELEPAKLDIFPNPSSALLNIQSQEVNLISLRLSDVSGRILVDRQFEQAQQNIELSTHYLANGLYLIEGRLADGRPFGEKIIVQH
ncbi:MAG: T9SS type A sorting domain-containing protein [Bacteroidota bacterium]